jgi:hypothetical protein
VQQVVRCSFPRLELPTLPDQLFLQYIREFRATVELAPCCVSLLIMKKGTIRILLMFADKLVNFVVEGSLSWWQMRLGESAA